MTILAALIEYDVDGVTKYLGVTSGKYTNTTGVTLEDGLWYPVMSSDVSWSEQARHPYQDQGGELVVGDLELANDGTLDWLIDADMIGKKVTLKRGGFYQSWADMEMVFIARSSGRRFEGHSVIIELDNWLAELSGPVYSETFGEDTPNPQLIGKQIPYVLGKVTQAPVLEFQPNALTYYTAANVSLIGEVAEGGNPTQTWALGDQPKFSLQRSPTLPITATYEGPSDTPWTTIIDDDLNTWVSGSDSALTSPYTNQGDKPSGWALIVGNDMPPIGVTVTQSTGMRINDLSGAMNAASTESSVTTTNAQSAPVGSSSVIWTNASAAVRDDSGEANVATGAGATDAIKVTIDNFKSAGMAIQTNHTINSGTPVLGSVAFVEDNSFAYVEQLNRPLPGLSYSTLLRPWSVITPDNLGDTTVFQIKLRDDYVSDFSLGNFYAYGFYSEAPSVHLRRDLSLTAGQVYSAQIEGTTSDDVSLMFGASNSTAIDWPEHADYLEFINNGCANEISTDFSISSTFTASGSVFNLSYQPAFGNVGANTNGRFGDVTINRVKVVGQVGGNKSYKGLIPHIVTTAGYTTSEVDQTMIDAHADEYGDPELGWLITNNESADQVLFRLAGSLFGYLWHGLDGKVHSKRLKAPTPVDDPFIINSTRANPDEIVAYDDPAPNLRRSVNALRNWRPLSQDQAAGITTTWTEEERAKVLVDWRITRDWEMDADGKAEFKRRWPNVAAREPLSTALRDETTCQLVANEGPDLWLTKPMFFEIPVQVNQGELADVAVGETVKAELDYPGLDDTWLLVLGRAGTANPGLVNLTLWSAGIAPLTLLSTYREDPRVLTDRNGEATYFDVNGDLQVAAADESRLTYDRDTNEPLGWLIENAATNYLANGDAPATQTGISVSSGAYTLSVYGSGSAELDNGTITAMATEGTPATLSGTSFDVTVTGSLDYFQLEAGPVATSPIITGSSSESRLADDVSVSDFSTIWNADSGTVVIEVTPQGTAARDILRISDGTANNFILLEITGSALYRARIVTGGATQASLTGIAAVNGQTARLCLSFDANDIDFFVDGVLRNSDNTATIPTVSQLAFGKGFVVSNASYYDSKLTDTQAASAATVAQDLIREKV